MLVHRHNPSATTSGGVWSGNTERFVAGALCYQVYIKSASNDTTFTLTITDRDDVEIRKFTTVTALINDLTPFLVKGVVTLSISAASADEAFTVLLCFRE